MEHIPFIDPSNLWKYEPISKFVLNKNWNMKQIAENIKNYYIDDVHRANIIASDLLDNNGHIRFNYESGSNIYYYDKDQNYLYLFFHYKMLSYSGVLKNLPINKNTKIIIDLRRYYELDKDLVYSLYDLILKDCKFDIKGGSIWRLSPTYEPVEYKQDSIYLFNKFPYMSFNKPQPTKPGLLASSKNLVFIVDDYTFYYRVNRLTSVILFYIISNFPYIGDPKYEGKVYDSIEIEGVSAQLLNFELINSCAG